VLDMVVRAIGDTIQILAQSVDPRLIILGGGMAKTGEPLVEVITAELRRRESQCRFLETLDLPARPASGTRRPTGWSHRCRHGGVALA